MLLAFGIVRLLDLRDEHPQPRSRAKTKYEIVGRSRAVHRAASVIACIAAAIPILQLNGRLAELVMDKGDRSPLAPYEMLGARPALHTTRTLP